MSSFTKSEALREKAAARLEKNHNLTIKSRLEKPKENLVKEKSEKKEKNSVIEILDDPLTDLTQNSLFESES